MRRAQSTLQRRGRAPRAMRRLAFSLGACAVLISLASCDTAQNILDSNDVCRDQRAALRSFGDYFAQDILIGGGIGAAAGAIVGAATHQSVGTTLGLTAGGFAIGAGAGYWAAVQQKNADTAARQRQVLTDIDANNAKIDSAQAAFNDLIRCRQQEAARLKADVAAGRLSQTDGGKRMADIRSRYDDDVALGKKVGANIGTHSADLEFANEQLKPQPYVTQHSATIYATMDQAAAKLETLRSGAVISGAAVDATWVKVTLARGRTGYMLASDVQLQAESIVANKARRHSPPPATKGDPVAEGVFTNLSKRADFDDSVQTASANTSGFRDFRRLILASCPPALRRQSPLAAAILMLVALAATSTAAQTTTTADPPTTPFLRVEAGMHTAEITDLATDGQAALIATASTDKTVRLWHADGGSPIATLRVPIAAGAEGELNTVAVAPDGKHVLAGGSTGYSFGPGFSIYLFDTDKQAMIGRLAGLPAAVMDIAYAPSGKSFAIGFAKTAGMRLYDSGGKQIGDDRDYGDRVSTIAFADDDRFAVSSYDGQIRLYDAAGHLVAKAKAPGGARPSSLAFSPDSKSLAIGYDDAARVDVLAADTLKPQAQPRTGDLQAGALSTVGWTGDASAPVLLAGGSVRNRDDAVIVRRWSKGGAGAASDVAVGRDLVTKLVGLPGGGFAFATADPAWGIVGANNKVTYRHASPINDFRVMSERHFDVSPDGLTVVFIRQHPAIRSTASICARAN